MLPYGCPERSGQRRLLNFEGCRQQYSVNSRILPLAPRILPLAECTELMLCMGVILSTLCNKSECATLIKSGNGNSRFCGEVDTIISHCFSIKEVGSSLGSGSQIRASVLLDAAMCSQVELTQACYHSVKHRNISMCSFI
jgi:hypothetical protein